MEAVAKIPRLGTLEKQYGDVKALLKKRADRIGLDTEVLPEGIRKIDDLSRLVRHIETYDGTAIGLLATNIRNVVNLYELDVNGGRIDAHVLWLFKDIGEFTKNRYRYNRYILDSGMAYMEGYSEAGTDWLPNQMTRAVFEAIYRDPSMMSSIDALLLKNFARALEFYDWRDAPSGLVLTGKRDYAFALVGAVRRYGNDALGIGVGMQLIEPLINEIAPGNYYRLDSMITSIFVHELTHLHRSDRSEVAEHAVMLLVDPEHNVYVEILKQNIEYWTAIQNAHSDNNPFTRMGDYEIQKYIGLVLMINEFARYNDDIKGLFDNDETGSKLFALGKSIDIIRNSDAEKVIASGFLDRLLNEDIAHLVERIEIIDGI